MLWAKILGGAMLGAAAGALLGRARVCGTQGCHLRSSMVASILAGALMGAAVAMVLSR